ncbi:hypothetical protein Tco_0064517 [Tanacetum coccineum]
MRKLRYVYLEEIVVRRVDNVLYRFKEGDFPLLRINDIEDMLILVVQNRLINLSGDHVADFAIATKDVHQKSGYLEESSSYMGKRRWRHIGKSKKKSYFLIKDINKLLKERRRMRSLEKFDGDRLYEN